MKSHPPKWLYILLPGITMLLGWGLRGYIGGGPFGAMIPGSLVAMSLCLLLGFSVEQASIITLFGVIGIGFGGEMTYGQTIGFVRASDTLLWGLLGLTLKGAVWGLLGGTCIGIAFSRNKYSRKTLVIGLLLSLVGFYLGWKLINDPKLVYFSNRINKPRDESWAGLLFMAVSLLAYFKIKAKDSGDFLPLRFALWGTLGGGLGFGLGGLWMAFGHMIPVNQRWFGWWKFMEFTFGFLFGAALGLCTWRNRGKLKAKMDADVQIEKSTKSFWSQLGVFAIIAIASFWLMSALSEQISHGLENSQAFLLIFIRDWIWIFGGFVFIGIMLIIIGLYSKNIAWQIAITLTFCHTVIDLNRDMLRDNGFAPHPLILWSFLFLTTTFVAVFVIHWLQSKPQSIKPMFLLLTWGCMFIAVLKGFMRKSLLFPEAGAVTSKGSWLCYVADTLNGVLVVHGIFFTSAIVVTWFLFRYWRENEL